jgi:hypothetical protein
MAEQTVQTTHHLRRVQSTRSTLAMRRSADQTVDHKVRHDFTSRPLVMAQWLIVMSYYFAVYQLISFHGATAPRGPGPPYCQRFTIILKTHHTRYDSSGRGISPTQRPLPDNAQHSQRTEMHALGGVRTHNPSMRAAEDTRPTPYGHWDRPVYQTIPHLPKLRYL